MHEPEKRSAYSLISDMEERKRSTHCSSLLARLIEEGFRVLRTDAPHPPRPFDPEWGKAEQLTRLPRAMIRNNRAAATDLKGTGCFNRSTYTTGSMSIAPTNPNSIARSVNSSSTDARTRRLSTDARKRRACSC